MGRVVGKIFLDEKELNLDELISLANEKGLISLNLNQLKIVAKELGIEFDSKIKKNDLIKLIDEVQGVE